MDSLVIGITTTGRKELLQAQRTSVPTSTPPTEWRMEYGLGQNLMISHTSLRDSYKEFLFSPTLANIPVQYVFSQTVMKHEDTDPYLIC